MLLFLFSCFVPGPGRKDPRCAAAPASTPPSRPRSCPPTSPPATTCTTTLYLRPTFGLLRPQPWAPLTDAEWAALRPILAEHGCGVADHPRPGRPMADARARLDAIFRAVTLKRPRPQGGGRAAWNQLPPEFGKADTVSRTYRRWCAADLWMRLLQVVGAEDCPEVLARLTHRICCAFRRGIRLMGLRAIVLARRLRLYSALPAPSFWLPDPDLSEIYMPVISRPAAPRQGALGPPAGPGQPPPDRLHAPRHGRPGQDRRVDGAAVRAA
ncbi:transposase [Dankookia sp. P2]|uniref:transposase n=1 Tax=Dankookia sp. P2 TaxID=3423955 RepID=UPI003D6747FD